MDDRELLLFDIVNLSLLARNNFSRTIRETTFNIFASLELGSRKEKILGFNVHLVRSSSNFYPFVFLECTKLIVEINY